MTGRCIIRRATLGYLSRQIPRAGNGRIWASRFNVGDPCLFADTDGKVYLYYGLAYNGSISVVELDPKNKFNQMGQPTVCMKANPAEHGWERRGDDNLGGMSGSNFQDGPWLEGSWMSKKGDTYYLQYAAPGTEFSTYADGVYTSKSPKGPFVYSQNSPFSAKPTGFITGAGHSATFADKQGQWWHISTMRISIKHDFERRLGLFPVEFDADGVMHTNTLFGDYPTIVPAQRKAGQADLFAGWMLLSYGKRGTASSSIESLEPKNAFDEDVRTYWSARSDKPGEFLTVNLNKQCRIDAVQVNFAEHEATAVGRNAETYHQYKLEASADGTTWIMLADKSANKVDAPHDYVQLNEPVMANQVRITNVGMAGGGTFSIRDLRVFGSGMGNAPAAAPKFEVIRDASDKRNATIRWDMLNDATGYVVRYGTAPSKLYQNREIRGKKEISIHDLNVGAEYYYTVDAFNDTGVTKGEARPGK